MMLSAHDRARYFVTSLVLVTLWQTQVGAQTSSSTSPAQRGPSSATSSAAPSAGSAIAWQRLDGLPSEVLTAQPWIRPTEGQALVLDPAAMTAQLNTAPRVDQCPIVRESPALIELPTPDGRFERFAFVEWPVMEPELQARFPQIRTYLGQGLDDPAASVAIDLTPQGFHAQVLRPSSDGTTAHRAWYIDPLSRGDATHYASYARGALLAPEPWTCSTPTGLETTEGEPAPRAPNETVVLKSYRVAVAASGEYTTYVSPPGNPNVVAGLAAVVTTVNRVNQVYHIDLAINLILVANNDQIIYTNAATDPYSGDIPSMQCQNAQTLHNVIGDANFDIGHLCHQGDGGGNAGGVGTVCNNGDGGCPGGPLKARGFTGSYAPTGTFYWIDYVAHEMGHQFGGSHTFNGIRGSCGDARAAGSAYEPGSGITIMGYAGICHDGTGSDDLATASPPNGASIPMFSFKSIQQIADYTNGQGCGAAADTGNHPPSVVATPGPLPVPTNTPFFLSAGGIDSDPGQQLSYSWEQMDLGPALMLGPDTGQNEPLFKPHMHGLSEGRFCPPLANIAAGTTALGEYLPQFARTAHFRVVVRDNNVQGGGTGTFDEVLQFVAVPGGFSVTGPGSGAFCGGTNLPIAWNVANTDQPPINCDRVLISLSTDGGLTFPTILATNLPNSGSAFVTLPWITTSQARIKVESHTSPFFSVNPANFGINPGPPTIVQQPPTTASFNVCSVGAITVMADGPPPLSFQWRKDGVNLTNDGHFSGVTTETLFIDPVRQVDAGAYDVVVTNPQAEAGCSSSITSSSSNVIVIGSPPPWTDHGLIGPASEQYSMAYDSDRNVTVVVGGGQFYYATNYIYGTYEWDGTQWETYVDGPTGRIGAAMAYDSNRHRMVLFGGSFYGVKNSETWERNGTQWSLITDSGPAPRLGAAMAYDSDRQVMVMCGGTGGPDGYLDDWWEWNGAVWTQRAFPGPRPNFYPVRHGIAYDSVRGVMVVNASYETWELEGDTWASRYTFGNPAPGGNMCFDSRRGVCVAYGGPPWVPDCCLTSEWNGDTWNIMPYALPNPGPVSGIAVAFDSLRGETVLQGGWAGFAYSSRTWTWRNNSLGVTRHPKSQAVCAGASVTFTAAGLGINDTPVTFQWRHNGVPIPGATGNTLTIDPATVGDTGSYDVVVSDCQSSLASRAATLSVSNGPTIDYQPADMPGCVGQYAYFSVYSSDPAATYQWRKNSVDLTDDSRIVGSNDYFLQIYPVAPGDAGVYDVVLTDQCGSTISDPATLTFGQELMITQQPAPQTVAPGQTVQFTADAVGTAPLYYYWQHDGEYVYENGRITGASTTTLTISPVVPCDAGQYACVVYDACTNEGGPATTLPATLTVTGATGPDGDVNDDGRVDGQDIDYFMLAVIYQSAYVRDLCHGDYNQNGVLDPDDVAGFIQALLQP